MLYDHWGMVQLLEVCAVYDHCGTLQADARKKPVPAVRYGELDGSLAKRDLIAEVRALNLGSSAISHPEADSNGIAYDGAGSLSLSLSFFLFLSLSPALLPLTLTEMDKLLLVLYGDYFPL